jgi:hypothetical protein
MALALWRRTRVHELRVESLKSNLDLVVVGTCAECLAC